MSISAVLFDIGGVIVSDGPDMAAVSRIIGLPPGSEDAVRDAVWAERDAYDLGTSDSDYWKGVARRSGAEAPSTEIIRQLVDNDVSRWSRPRADTVSLIGALSATGLKLGILSNAPASFAKGFSSQGWTRVFSALVFSCNTGVVKPAPAAYDAAVQSLDVPPEEILFFDDRQANVDGARELGLRSERWTGAEDAYGVLVNYGIPLR